MNKQQEAYQEKIEAQLKEWSAQIDGLKAKAQKAEADAKLKYYDAIEDLRIKENAVRQKLTGLKDAGGDAWENLKAGVEAAVQSLREALSKQ